MDALTDYKDAVAAVELCKSVVKPPHITTVGEMTAWMGVYLYLADRLVATTDALVKNLTS